MNELNGLINLISSIRHNKPAKFFGYFPDAVILLHSKQAPGASFRNEQRQGLAHLRI